MKHTKEGRLFTDIVLEIFKLNGLLILEGDELTKEQGLSSARWKILGAISLSPTPMTVPQIARNMGQTRQAVQRLVNEMENDELLTFKNNPHHKKAKLVELTLEGKNAYYQLTQKQIPWANSISSKITSSDLQLTLSVLLKLIDSLET
ncbi:MAG: MarR family transcriptional regulator [Gammaproteobacteria bacterium]|nr:MarR family transcriptional regulator [Gammaproteobacteria bacterium]